MPNEYHLEFGPASAPLLPNYERCALGSYSPEIGYGLLPTTYKADTRDRIVGQLPQRTFIISWRRLTFAIDLPNGQYTVAIKQGDQAYPTAGMQIWFQGEHVTNVSTQRNQIVATSQLVSITTGQLVVDVISGTPDIAAVLLNLLDVAPAQTPLGQNVSLVGTRILSSQSAIHQNVSSAPVLPDSLARIQNQTAKFIGTDWGVDYPVGSGTPYGFPYFVVDSSQPKVKVTVSNPYHNSDLDPGDPNHYSVPIPPNAQTEGGNDRHAIVLERDSGTLYEFYKAAFDPSAGTWAAACVVTFNIAGGDDQRKEGIPSSTASGLTLLGGIIKYDETAAGMIEHALLMTIGGYAGLSPRYFIPPAQSIAGTYASPLAIPFGTRIRLKADFDVSGFSAMNQTILNCLKTYGAIIYDGGPAWGLQGANDPRWNQNDVLKLRTVPREALEILDLNFGPGYTITLPADLNFKVGVASAPFTITLLGNRANSQVGVYPADDLGVQCTPYRVDVSPGNPVATFTYKPKNAGTRTLNFTNPYVGRINPSPITVEVLP